MEQYNLKWEHTNGNENIQIELETYRQGTVEAYVHAGYRTQHRQMSTYKYKCIGVGTMGAGGAIAPPPIFFYFSQALPDHILIKLLYCT